MLFRRRRQIRVAIRIISSRLAHVFFTIAVIAIINVMLYRSTPLPIRYSTACFGKRKSNKSYHADLLSDEADVSYFKEFGNPITLAECFAQNRMSLFHPNNENFTRLVGRSYRTDGAVPQAFAKPASEADVQKAVICARKAGVGLCARSGGHSFSGSSLCNGVVLDLALLSEMRFAGPVGVGVTSGEYDIVVAPSITLGDLLTFVHVSRRRWLGAGICPQVGVGGYVFGGGHGPYDTMLGLGCDALRSFRVVDYNGRVVVASRHQNTGLFWSGCGAGAGHFGIVTQMTLRTAPASPFDNSAAFRIKWPITRAGELFEALSRVSLSDAKVWLRAVILSPSPEKSVIVVFGACFDLRGDKNNTSECFTRLTQLPFFYVGEKTFVRVTHARDARVLHKLLSDRVASEGNVSPAIVDSVLLGQQYQQGGRGDNQTIHSVFVRLDKYVGQREQQKFWQNYAETCQMTHFSKLSGVSVQVCHVNPFHLKMNLDVGEERLAAFPYRDADFLLFSYTNGGNAAAREIVYNRLSQAVKRFTIGVYLNYPQRQLSRAEYPRLYWGNRLERLLLLKRIWDPESLFLQQQPIPVDDIEDPVAHKDISENV